MKNIYVLPTDKPSRVFITNTKPIADNLQVKINVYITNDEEIKEGDNVLALDTNTVFKVSESDLIGIKKFPHLYKKIILTTDQDLIKDGVQAIDDEFLEWFVKNPSCESIEIEKLYKANPKYKEGTQLTEKVGYWKYKIIIPKEETKQTAVEWLAERLESITQNLFEQAKEMEKQQKGYNQEKVFEIERFRAIDFAKWFADFNGLTRDEKRVTKEHLETLYEKYLQTLGGGLLNK